MARAKRPTRGRSWLNGEGTISGATKGRPVCRGLLRADHRRDPQACLRLRSVLARKHTQGSSRSRPRPPGHPGPAQSWTLGPYLDYWLEHVVKPTRRPATLALYEMTVRVHLVPALGKYPLKRLSVRSCRSSLTASSRQAGRFVTSTSCARSSAPRSPARSARNWSPAMSLAWSSCPPGNLPMSCRGHRPRRLAFLAAARDDPLYPAFVLLLLYGMRRGEVLGLRWTDIDFEGGVIHVRQQVHRAGQLYIGPLKTRAGSRDLPVIGLARVALTARLISQQADHASLGSAWTDTGLVFTTSTGRR